MDEITQPGFVTGSSGSEETINHSFEGFQKICGSSSGYQYIRQTKENDFGCSTSNAGVVL